MACGVFGVASPRDWPSGDLAMAISARHVGRHATVVSQQGHRPRSKYKAVPTVIDGIRFDSKKEAKRYAELRLLEKANEIWDLRLQPEFPLMVPGVGNGGPYERVCVGKYVADFQYLLPPRGVLVVEDVKGFKTPLYRWKKKHVEAQYGIQIREI